MEPRITLITLGTRNLERSVRFYRDGLGWKRSSVGEETNEVAFFHTGGCILAVWLREALARDVGVPDDGTGFAGFSLAHNVRTREEVDRVLKTVERAGGSIARPGKELDWGGYAGYFADPDGHLWEVAWNPGFPILEDGTVDLPD
ncbi:MAG TPA: VOC family protein [Chloroflexota bacterium]|jgi:catechol 2,3-dioxygenase-like lactoylglutathione lyase family enzyme|nr:VOC family protein [Chloroflexota bacterium]